MVEMTKDELEQAAAEFLGGNITDLPLARLQRLITVSQFVTDTILNEIEERGELTFFQGDPIIPYHAEHHVETVLTRSGIGSYLPG